MPSKKGEPKKMLPDLEAEFLNYFQDTGRVADSATHIGMTANGVLLHRKAHPEFEERYQAAYSVFKDKINREVYNRAVFGTPRPIFYKGEVVGRVAECSDRMLEMLAKRHMPEYREKQQLDVNLSAGVLIVPGVQKKDEEWEKAYRVDDDGNPVEELPAPGNNVERG